MKDHKVSYGNSSTGFNLEAVAKFKTVEEWLSDSMEVGRLSYVTDAKLRESMLKDVYSKAVPQKEVVNTVNKKEAGGGK